MTERRAESSKMPSQEISQQQPATATAQANGPTVATLNTADFKELDVKEPNPFARGIVRGG